MHYYKRHLGDYARDTGHLTALEHGVYTLLLDWYYVNERPIPADKAARIARGNPEETQTVLSEFFTLTDSGWRHGRADREIESYKAKAETNREVGKRGGRPRKTQTEPRRNPEETQTVSRNNPDITLTTNHKPLTIKEQKQEPARSPNGARLPSDWALPDEWRDWAEAERPDVDAIQQSRIFVDYWAAQPGAKGRKADWQATWRNWIRRADAPRGAQRQDAPSKTLQSIQTLMRGSANAQPELARRGDQARPEQAALLAPRRDSGG